MSTYPFLVSEDDDQITIQVATESDEIMGKYVPLFEEFTYSGNGYTWEGLIMQLLEKENPAILDEIEFDSEAGTFVAYTGSRTAQAEFIKTVVPVFKDPESLRPFLKQADRSRVSD